MYRALGLSCSKIELNHGGKSRQHGDCLHPYFRHTHTLMTLFFFAFNPVVSWANMERSKLEVFFHYTYSRLCLDHHCI